MVERESWCRVYAEAKRATATRRLDRRLCCIAAVIDHASRVHRVARLDHQP